MQSAHAFQFEPIPAEHLERNRRMPDFAKDLAPPRRQDEVLLSWPESWPAALFTGEANQACKVHMFSDKGAQLTMFEPPAVGTQVSLKFPFTIYLKGRVAWSRGQELGIDFDEGTQRSARIVEDVLLDNTGI